MFIINIKYDVDEITNSENYLIEIDSGVIHPTYIPQAQKMFEFDLNSLINPIKKSRFTRKDKLEQISITANYLIYVIKYVLGMVYFFDQELELANEQFSEIYSNTRIQYENILVIKILNNLLPERLYATNMELAVNSYNKYALNKDKSYLTFMESYLKLSNEYKPETYSYYLNSALVSILKNKDIKQASYFILRCRQYERYSEWRYSDAFLSAYTCSNPMTIYRKYSKAFMYPYNVIEIASFIEDVLEEEPDKYSLNLALGLVYEHAENTPLMKKHFLRFINIAKENPKNQKIIELLNEKLNNYSCNVQCTNSCESCLPSAWIS